MPPRGLVISDLQLCSGITREEGLVLARNSYEQRKRLRQGFILQTAEQDSGIKRQIDDALREGIIDQYLKKPLEAKAVYEAVAEILARNRD